MAFAENSSPDFDANEQSFYLADNANADHSECKSNDEMYNLPARPILSANYDFWVMGDLLFWQAVEEKLTYVYSGTLLGAVPDNHNLNTMQFNWDFGFRVGTGYNCSRDGWDIALYWTHMHNTAHGSKHAHGNQSLIQAISSEQEILAPPIASASAHWHADLDQIDLQLGREAYVGNYLTLRPFVGMRSTWLFQVFNVKTVNAAAQEQKAHLLNKFWGYGFSCGLDMDWLFKKGFSLYGNANYSLLLGFFKVREKGREDDELIWFLKNSFRSGRSIFDIGMGLKWVGLFCKERFGLTLKAGYEYHMYFNQNQLSGNKLSVGTLNGFSSQGGNLLYQGAIGSVQFDF